MTNNIVVSKFGGSSMANYEAMVRSAEIAIEQSSSIVLVSATYGTTNALIELTRNAVEGKWGECEKSLFRLRENHFDICQKSTSDDLISEKVRTLLNELETLIRGVYLLRECSLKAKDQILSFGERLSSTLFAEVVKGLHKEKTVLWLDIRSILKTDSNHSKATPIISEIEKEAKSQLDLNKVYITQGFIGSDEFGATTTLGRGGSDYSASLIAEAVNATKLEIWTDVAGIATTDPRICKEAISISEISYDEASEMAQYGAKVLHPTTLVPAIRKNIPVFVGSSYSKEQNGTWIRNKVEAKPVVRAITKRTNQSLLTIKTPKMLNAFGFMGRIFQIFEKHQISVDCVTTSEICVAVTVDEETLTKALFLKELRNIAEVQIEKGHCLISLIGNDISQTKGLAKDIFNTISETNIRMMCLGASDYNFNFLVDENQADQVINDLHQKFIGLK